LLWGNWFPCFFLSSHYCPWYHYCPCTVCN
jgi:hypothetical protein